MDKHIETEAPESTPSNPFLGAAGSVPAVWLQPAQRFASAMAALNAEIMSFASRRFDANGKAWAACAKCTDLAELSQMQGKFLGDMAADYTSETAELARRAQDIMWSVGNEPSK